MSKYTFYELTNIIDFARGCKADIRFIVDGDLAFELCNYVYCELGIEEYTEDGNEPFILDKAKAYYFDINGDENHYYIQECIYNGITLGADGGYMVQDTIVDTIDVSRIGGNYAIFTYEDEFECNIGELNKVIANLNDRITALEEKLSNEKAYYINDKRVTEKEYENYYRKVLEHWFPLSK